LFSNKALAPQSSKTSLVEKQLQFAYDTHRYSHIVISGNSFLAQLEILSSKVTEY